jgi:hemolysin III
MPSSTPVGPSRRVNQIILSITLGFSATGLIVLLCLAPVAKHPWRTAAYLVYGATLLACSLCSFLYHTLEAASRRALLRLLDHAAIFLFIAGTYTAFASWDVPGPFGWSLLGWVWGLALLGVVLKIFLDERHDRLFVLLYLGIGWLAVTGLDDLLRNLNPVSFDLLAAGGAAYTVGALIYARDVGPWTDPVWHAFVLAGTGTHFAAVVLPLMTT